ncbi:MAG: DNA primase [Nitrospinota bacterium]
MVRFSNSFISDLKNRAAIEEIIGLHVKLKLDGANYKGLCPFHTEKSPSFIVSPSKEIFHCFGCGEGGNVFSFLMKYENLTFVQAIESVANFYSITLPQTRSDDRYYEKNDRLISILEEAAKIYHQNLLSAKVGSKVKEYLRSRNISKESAKRFMLGYSGSDDWNWLQSRLEHAKFSLADMREVGLVKSSKRGSDYDTFAGRLIFPIRSASGKVVGFGGRVIDDNQQGAKYINSPETPFFKKSNLLYGLHEAQSEIRAKKSLIIVEGYLDLIALEEIGISNVVAVLGVALTKEHAKRLSRITDEVILLFDNDEAGRNALERSGWQLKSYEIALNVLKLESSKDPDSFIKKFGKEKFIASLESKKPFIKYIIDERRSKLTKNDRESAIKVAASILPYIALEKNLIRVEEDLLYLSEQFSLNYNALKSEFSRTKSNNSNLTSQLEVKHLDENKNLSNRMKSEKLLLAILLNEELSEDFVAKIDEDDFSIPINKEIFSVIRKNITPKKEKVPIIDITDLEGNDLAKEFASLESGKYLYNKVEFRVVAADCLRNMKSKQLSKKSIQTELLDALKTKDKEKIAAIQDKIVELQGNH